MAGRAAVPVVALLTVLTLLPGVTATSDKCVCLDTCFKDCSLNCIESWYDITKDIAKDNAGPCCLPFMNCDPKCKVECKDNNGDSATVTHSCTACAPATTAKAMPATTAKAMPATTAKAMPATTAKAMPATTVMPAPAITVVPTLGTIVIALTATLFGLGGVMVMFSICFIIYWKKKKRKDVAAPADMELETMKPLNGSGVFSSPNVQSNHIV